MENPDITETKQAQQDGTDSVELAKQLHEHIKTLPQSDMAKLLAITNLACIWCVKAGVAPSVFVQGFREMCIKIAVQVLSSEDDGSSPF